MTTQEAFKKLRALGVPSVDEILDQIDAESTSPAEGVEPEEPELAPEPASETPVA